MNQPRPGSRISSLEKRATTIEASIEELSSDTAEELKVIRQAIDTGFSEVKQELKKMTSFEEVDAYLKLVATKEDVTELKTRFDKVEAKQDEQGKQLQAIQEQIALVLKAMQQKQE